MATGKRDVKEMMERCKRTEVWKVWEFEEFECLKSLRVWRVWRVWRVLCSALWVLDYSAVGILVVGEQPYIVEDISTLIEDSQLQSHISNLISWF